MTDIPACLLFMRIDTTLSAVIVADIVRSVLVLPYAAGYNPLGQPGQGRIQAQLFIMLFMANRGGPAAVVSSGHVAHWELRISAYADRVAEGLRRYKYVVLFLFSSLYLLATCYRASQKLFWFDELATVYMSRLPDMASVWNALKHGADYNPPLFYALTRFSESLFGEGHIGTRLPAILGFWIFCLCLFRFVSARTSVLAGLIAMLFPLVATAYYYAYEARPYGIVTGFAGIALVCWQAGIRSSPRRWWLIGLFGALFCAILNHTWAILLIVPLALAESVRSVSLRRIDWAVWLAIAFPSSAALFSVPMWRVLKATSPPTFFPAKGSVLASSYLFHLGPAVGVISAALILYFIFNFASPSSPPTPIAEESLELHEVVALLGLVALPFFAFFLAKLTHAPIFGRYSISTVAGFACLFGIASAKRRPVGLGVLFFLVAQIGLNFYEYSHTLAIIEPSSSTALSTTPDTFASRYQAMDAGPDKSLPIVLLDDLEFWPLMYYAPANLASRLVYVMSPGRDRPGEMYVDAQRSCPVPGRIERLAHFISTHDTFLIHSNARSFYRLDYFIRTGAELKIESASMDSFLISVTVKKNRAESAASLLQ